VDEDEKGNIISNDVAGRPNHASIINESGLFSLVLGSRKPEAKAFKKWVTSEVLPAIRKTGSYSAPPPRKTFNVAGLDVMVPEDFTESLRTLATVAERAKELASKAEFYDAVAATEGLLHVTDFAKLIGSGEHYFYVFLEAAGDIVEDSGKVHGISGPDRGNVRHRQPSLPAALAVSR
jgi:prophage antirepressor-like protein